MGRVQQGKERDTHAGSEEYIVIMRSRIRRETKTMRIRHSRRLLLVVCSYMGKGHDEIKGLECTYCTVHYI